MEEAKRKSEMSDGAKSLYGNGRSGKDTFTTMGTSSFEYDDASRPSISIALPNQSNPTRVDPPVPLRST